MAWNLGYTILKITVIGNSSELVENIKLFNIHITEDFDVDSKGLIILNDFLNHSQKIILEKSNELRIPILGIQNGFDGLNQYFGGSPSISTKKNCSQVFLSPGAKLSHIIGGSGWVKGNLKIIKTIFNKDLSDNFFASIISDEGEVLGFEKPGNHWQFGIRFDTFSSENPRGFEKIISVFFDKCAE
tara:strand:+ start:2886 stop:3443 length:558 start_codon:yes stop_codon:yes gene_type:complete